MWESFDFSLIVIKQRKNIREIEEKSVSLHSLSKTKYRRFLPLVKKEGALAQVVEQWTENPCVLGSTPRGTTPPFILPGFPVMEFGPFLLQNPLHTYSQSRESPVAFLFSNSTQAAFFTSFLPCHGMKSVGRHCHLGGMTLSNRRNGMVIVAF